LARKKGKLTKPSIFFNKLFVYFSVLEIFAEGIPMEVANYYTEFRGDKKRYAESICKWRQLISVCLYFFQKERFINDKIGAKRMCKI